MSKLQKYASRSKLMTLRINFGGKDYVFNLHQELKVTEARLNRELKEQASSYSFLTMLHKSLIKKYEQAEALKKRKYGQLYIRSKTGNHPSTGRPPSDDLAKQMVEAHPGYSKVVEDTIQSKYEMEIIGAAVKSFEQRKDMLQSLSANLRNENKLN